MENVLDILKQIKCKECKKSLHIKINNIKYDGFFDFYCLCDYMKYYISTNNFQCIVSSNRYNCSYRVVEIGYIYNHLHFRLNSYSANCFNELNTGLIFDKSLLFNLPEIEKALNVHSNLERNLIFK